MYAGWWFCCIPMKMIKQNGLPLPLFIRGDDVEFSLRNHAKFITMNGICIWHMGFTYKFNASMELYQVHRNSLILQAVSEVCQNVDFMNRYDKIVSCPYAVPGLQWSRINSGCDMNEFLKRSWSLLCRIWDEQIIHLLILLTLLFHDLLTQILHNNSGLLRNPLSLPELFCSL